MYTKIEKSGEIQHTGTDQELLLIPLLAIAPPARKLWIRTDIFGSEDGSPENLFVKSEAGIYVCNGVDDLGGPLPNAEVSSLREFGTVNWVGTFATGGYPTNLDPPVFGFYVAYGTSAGKSSGTYTVNWKFSIELREWE